MTLSDYPIELDDNEPDYQQASCLDRFRRENPHWSEEEIQAYIESQQS